MLDDADKGLAFDVAFLVCLSSARDEGVDHVVFVVKVLFGWGGVGEGMVLGASNISDNDISSDNTNF